MSLRAGRKGDLACTLGSVTHDRGRAPGSRFPRERAPQQRGPRRPHFRAFPGGGAPRPRGSLPAIPGQLPGAEPAPAALRARPCSAVSSPPRRPRPTSQLRSDGGKGDCPPPPFASQLGLLRVAGKPSLPSVLPGKQPHVPPSSVGSGKGLGRRAQEAATPRRQLQRPSSRHLVWRRSRRAPPCGEAGLEGGRRRRRAREGAEERSQRSPAATSGAPTHRAAAEIEVSEFRYTSSLLEGLKNHRVDSVHESKLTTAACRSETYRCLPELQ